ncbi:MAG TPA: sugar phosphate isomerase/epimerase [Armatimonadota bacterium]|nr:sugar phosphate isomerase/epimerase [Armatimonadota bacterium]
MKLGLHAYSLLLAGGLREYQPVGRGLLSAAQLLDKAAQLKFAAVQLARNNITDWDMVTLVNLRKQAEQLDLILHLSTNMLLGEHLADMIRAAYTLGAVQVTVGLSNLKGNVQQRQRTLEGYLSDLDVAIKTAERYKIMLTIENGRHTASADLAALIQAAQSEWVGVCYDMGNALTVPENPVEAAEQLAPFCKSAHMKDLKVYRTMEGATMVNCPVGEGVVEISEILRILKTKQPELTVFLQTAAERLSVPVLRDEFLQEYPRITARALAGLLRRGELTYPEEELQFPYETKTSEREVLKWEEERLKQSQKQAHKFMGTQSLTLSLE